MSKTKDIKQKLAVLDTPGSAAVILDTLIECGVWKGVDDNVIAGRTEVLIRNLKREYNSQLPKKKAPKSKQIDLEDSIAEIKADKPFWDKMDRVYAKATREPE
jgi:hypothetical protein